MSHKETLLTGSSTNAEEDLLLCSNDTPLYHTIGYKFARKGQNDLKGWINDSQNKFSTLQTKIATKKVRRTLSTKQKNQIQFYSDETDKQKTKEILKMMLLQYTGHPIQQNPKQKQIQSKNRSIEVEKYDFIRGQRLKGFQRHFKNKQFSITKKTRSTTLSKDKGLVQKNSPSKKHSPDSLENKKKVIQMINFPLPCDFMQYIEEQKFQKKLYFYLGRSILKRSST